MKKENHHGLTAALLRLRILRVTNRYNRATITQGVLGRLALESLAGNDAVDFYAIISWTSHKRETGTIVMGRGEQKQKKKKTHLSGCSGKQAQRC